MNEGVLLLGVLEIFRMDVIILYSCIILNDGIFLFFLNWGLCLKKIVCMER